MFCRAAAVSALAILALHPLAGQSALTVDQAQAEALANHPLLTAADGRISTAQGLLEQAALRPNHKLTVQLENLRFGWQTPYRPLADNDQFLYVTHVLETAGKRERRTDLARVNQSIADAARKLLAQQVAAGVRRAFWQALGAARAEDAARASATNYAQILAYHEASLQEGAISELDVLRVRIELEKTRLAVQEASRAATAAVIALQRELGRTQITPALGLVGTLDPAPPLMPPDPVQALDRRQEITLARLGADAARANERLQISLARPDMELSAGYKRTNPGVDTLLAYFNMDLPTRNRNQGNIAAAAAETKVASSNLAAAEALVRASAESAWADYDARRRTLASTLAGLKQRAAENARIAQAAYREGGTDLLRMLDAEKVLLETNLLEVQWMTDLKLSETALLAAQGLLP
jgi:outer membrane protein, heavy metal efflux system